MHSIRTHGRGESGGNLTAATHAAAGKIAEMRPAAEVPAVACAGAVRRATSGLQWKMGQGQNSLHSACKISKEL
jgi:hypothetical protein